jgi:hypothetical protein
VLLALDDGAGRRTELYDLGADPAETHPLPASTQDVGRRLEMELAALVSDMPAGARGPIVFPDAGLKDRLRALGYVQ